MLDGTEGNAEIGGFVDEPRHIIIYVDESQSSWTEQHGTYLVADDAHEHSQPLHTTKESCVFDDVVVGAIVLCLFLIGLYVDFFTQNGYI